MPRAGTKHDAAKIGRFDRLRNLLDFHTVALCAVGCVRRFRVRRRLITAEKAIMSRQYFGSLLLKFDRITSIVAINSLRKKGSLSRPLPRPPGEYYHNFDLHPLKSLTIGTPSILFDRGIILPHRAGKTAV